MTSLTGRTSQRHVGSVLSRRIGPIAQRAIPGSWYSLWSGPEWVAPVRVAGAEEPVHVSVVDPSRTRGPLGWTARGTRTCSASSWRTGHPTPRRGVTARVTRALSRCALGGCQSAQAIQAPCESVAARISSPLRTSTNESRPVVAGIGWTGPMIPAPRSTARPRPDRGRRRRNSPGGTHRRRRAPPSGTPRGWRPSGRRPRRARGRQRGRRDERRAGVGERSGVPVAAGRPDHLSPATPGTQASARPGHRPGGEGADRSSAPSNRRGPVWQGDRTDRSAPQRRRLGVCAWNAVGPRGRRSTRPAGVSGPPRPRPRSARADCRSGRGPATGSRSELPRWSVCGATGSLRPARPALGDEVAQRRQVRWRSQQAASRGEQQVGLAPGRREPIEERQDLGVARDLFGEYRVGGRAITHLDRPSTVVRGGGHPRVMAGHRAGRIGGVLHPPIMVPGRPQVSGS